MDTAETVDSSGDDTPKDTDCPANILVSPTEFHFGVDVGQTDQETVTLSNEGCDTLNTDDLSLADPEQPFTLGALGSILLPPGASTTFTVTFAPTEVGEFNTSLLIESNDPDEPSATVSLYGVAIDG